MDAALSSSSGSAKYTIDASFRPLLPAIDPSKGPSRSPPAPGPSTTMLAKRPAPTTSACAACRKRKVKCSGGRPQCARCKKLELDCIYETDNASETSGQAAKRKFTELHHRMDAYETVYSALRSRLDADVGAIIKRIRQGDDVETVARHISYGDVLLQVSLVPESRYRYVFPLVQEMPAYLFRPDNPYLGSLLYEWTLGGQATSPSSSPPADSAALHPADPYLKPYHAAEVVDFWLSAAKPSRWTSACSDDELMRRLLGRLLMVEYGGLWYLQKDYFLDDMGQMRYKLCSSLLVNALLALACFHEPGLPDRSEIWNPTSLSYKFLAEARRLWEIEQATDRLTNIQAAVTLSVILTICGADKIGGRYGEQAYAMAHRLGIFDGRHGFKSRRMREAADFTAWGTFIWSAITSFSFHRRPDIPRCPMARLPDPSTHPEWYGELWVRYPSSNTQHPVRHGYVFNALANLAVLMNDAADLLFPTRRDSISDLAALYGRLKKWHNGLPEPLLPRNIALPAQLKLHCWYHQTLIRILTGSAALQPDRTPEEDIELRAAFGGVHPRQIVEDARACLETLLRIYYLRHGFDYFDASCSGFFTQQGFISLELLAEARKSQTASGDDVIALRSTLILVAKCLYDQAHGGHLAKFLYQLLHGRLPPDVVEDLALFAGTEVTWKSQLRLPSTSLEAFSMLSMCGLLS